MDEGKNLPDKESLKSKRFRILYLSDFQCQKLKLSDSTIFSVPDEKEADEYTLKRSMFFDSPRNYFWSAIETKYSSDGKGFKNANQRLFWTSGSVYLVKKYWTLGCQSPLNNHVHVIITSITSLDIFTDKDFDYSEKLSYADGTFMKSLEKKFIKRRLQAQSKCFIPTNCCYVLVANQTSIFQMYQMDFNVNYLKTNNIKSIISDTYENIPITITNPTNMLYLEHH